MLIILADALLVLTLTGFTVLFVQKTIRDWKINSALAKQDAAAEQAKVVDQLNPEQININTEKVDKTLTLIKENK